MHLIENTGKSRIMDWHHDNKNRELNNVGDVCESYYLKFDNNNNIFEYSFDSVENLRKLMLMYMPDYSEKYLHELAVMAFKERFTLETFKDISDCAEKDTAHKNDNNDKFKIPDFVYVL
ncbi:MAG: hypothetical protein K5894_10755 [Lachnospiraceae bacterium]|nr:hypothetical protein [Lachnospiraceae bacterium]